MTVPATQLASIAATHGKFKIADTIVPEDYTRQQREAALKKAQLRTKQGEWPIVRVRDFYR